MGFFDFLKRKPDPEPEEERPSLHYVFAHYALRQVALSDPLQFLAILASPKVEEFFNAVIQDVTEHFGTSAAFGADSVKVHPRRVNGYPCAVIEMPEPRETAEAFFTALVVLVDPSAQEPPDSDQLKARYFTLEKGFSLDNEPRTVFAEWEPESHSNYGDGPPPTVDDFVQTIAAQL